MTEPPRDLPTPSGGHHPARQRFVLQATVVILVLVAVLILVLPIRIPKPLRIIMALTDLVAAAVIWLLARQRFGR